MSEEVDIAAAEARAAAAKQRLVSTAGELQERLAPKTLMREAVDNLSDLGRKAVGEWSEAGRKARDTGIEKARANPGAFIGGTALLVLVVGRRRLWALMRHRRKQRRPFHVRHQ